MLGIGDGGRIAARETTDLAFSRPFLVQSLYPGPELIGNTDEATSELICKFSHVCVLLLNRKRCYSIQSRQLLVNDQAHVLAFDLSKVCFEVARNLQKWSPPNDLVP